MKIDANSFFLIFFRVFFSNYVHILLALSNAITFTIYRAVFMHIFLGFGFTWFHTFHCIFDWTKCWIAINWLTWFWWICIKCSVHMIRCNILTNARQTTILLEFCELLEIYISTNRIHFERTFLTQSNLNFNEKNSEKNLRFTRFLSESKGFLEFSRSNSRVLLVIGNQFWNQKQKKRNSEIIVCVRYTTLWLLLIRRLVLTLTITENLRPKSEFQHIQTHLSFG